MKIGVPKEIASGEKRVALSPQGVKSFIKLGYDVSIETGAGLCSGFTDQDYQQSGANLISASSIWQQSDIVLKVRAPLLNEATGQAESDAMKPGTYLSCLFYPATQTALLNKIAQQGVTLFSLDTVPRISRAQKLDVLSSMANIAGYRAVVEAAHEFGRFFSGQVTAAGKVPPAQVFVIGCGVAGLSALGVAKGLGAIVYATDTRPEVKDQVASMGASWVGVPLDESMKSSDGYAKAMSEEFKKAQQALIAEQCKKCDIVITTALIPGRPAPQLITKEIIQTMKTGSVIVDMACIQGGNVEGSVADKVVELSGVKIIGYTDLASRLSGQASSLYSNNILRLFEMLTPEKNGTVKLDLKDEVLRGVTSTHQGEVLWPPPPISVSLQSSTHAANEAPATAPAPSKKTSPGFKNAFLIVGIVALFLVGRVAPPDFVNHFTVFVLSCFVGYMVIWNVTAALHTPLMSVTNAISSIIIIGGLLQISSDINTVKWLSFIAILLTAINMVGGFAVTRRMLSMFQKSTKGEPS